MPQRESLCAANYRAHVPWSLCATTREEKTRAPQLEKPAHHNKEPMPQQRSHVLQLRPDAAKKINKINKYFLKKEYKMEKRQSLQ